ncbi:hypothetical protein H4R33_001449 [Dimargaris cristalligena]|uniref:Uncharacterized protein n=1 Tax=Dimargaris cristalligena TaxID=215637 RepID=A0A4P9ZX72_9FUNG|nr:hypothetical protein H4R33_001449 [Dimargaris cristalligena]RKP37958.1 hypothetical protein BJ085DRAFT_39217 [Dimargaris cristalligena]|eukprot:RKP37958.1 hypothetical protein BJ085DRAFT_39217 [Dimargaris cristalligena]
MKVTRVFTMAFFVAAVAFLVASRVTAAPAIAKVDLPLPVSEWIAVSPSGALASLTRRKITIYADHLYVPISTKNIFNGGSHRVTGSIL